MFSFYQDFRLFVNCQCVYAGCYLIIVHCTSEWSELAIHALAWSHVHEAAVCDLSTQNTSLLLEPNGETLRPLSNSNVKRVVAADNRFIFIPVNCSRAPFDI